MNRGILFQPDMVRQIRDKRKRQTRRIIQFPEWFLDEYRQYGKHEIVSEISCPYGNPGDTLTVREAWRALRILDRLKPRELDRGVRVHYSADGPYPLEFGRYRHARFMPMHLARFRLSLVSVGVELLQDISEADSIEEGFTSRAEFLARFAEINGPCNPWCWVLTWD